jgi:chromate transporter
VGRYAALMQEEAQFAQVPSLTLARLVLRFLRFGLLAWGGPVAQIAMLRRELVDEEHWIPPERFNRTLAVYQVLPGPEAQELSVYFGMLARGRVGGLLAGLCFMLPGLLLMLALSWLYFEVGLNSPFLIAAFAGFQVAVLALIVRGLHRIAAGALRNTMLIAVALASMTMSVLGAPFVIPLAVGAVAQVLATRRYRALAASVILVGVGAVAASAILAPDTPSTAPDESALVRQPSLVDVFASGLRAGSLTFGGAYTAIPFLQDDAVAENGWMTNDEFLDGVALAGIIPAPLVIFATFVGFAGVGFGGAIAMTIGLFLPAFAITLAGHRYLEAVIANKRVHAVLDGITAGVIGLVAATALQLAPAAVRSWGSLALFVVALAILYVWTSKYAVALVILLAGVGGIAIAGR